MKVAATVMALAAVAAGAGTARAQVAEPPRIAPEVRLDAITMDDPALQLGVGVQVAAGYYARIGIDLAVGRPVGDSATDHHVDGRIDFLARFLLDPFRQSAYGISLGGGASLRAEHGQTGRPLLLVALDVEGRRASRGLVPAVQVGLGGGVRIGVILRRGAGGAR